MIESVRERIEVEAPVEEVFGNLSRLDFFCDFVRKAEALQRLDLGRSRWRVEGPTGHVEFDPSSFGGCSRWDRLTKEWSERLPSEKLRDAEAVVDGGEISLEGLPSGGTLLFLTTSYLADLPEPRSNSYFELGVLLAGLFSDEYRAPSDPAAAVEEAMTDEDRAWLEGDLGRLGEYDPYELTEEQLSEERPIRFVPGVGLLVDDEGDPEEDG